MKLAIICIAYNRIKSLKRLLNSLEQADYLGDSVPLIISIDKSDTDEVEAYADGYNWSFGSKHVKKHSENLGLRKHILSQGEEFNKYDAVIILEDDVIVSPAFYKYTKQCIDKYYDNNKIAGISLYSFPLNYLTNRPFEPQKNGYDVYFMNTAQSWGEVWMKNQWLEFYDWYLKNEDFNENSNVPQALFSWKKSWLKYHTRYCIENNKYFVYPYHSFSSNCGDVGTHATLVAYNNYQTSMQMDILRPLLMPDHIEDGVCYDAFFENKKIPGVLGISSEKLIVDLNGYRTEYTGCDYILTTKKLSLPVNRSFCLNYRPIEQNVFCNESGDDIFLYCASNKVRCEQIQNNLLLYQFRFSDILYIMRSYRLKNIIKEIVSRISHRFKIF